MTSGWAGFRPNLPDLAGFEDVHLGCQAVPTEVKNGAGLFHLACGCVTMDNTALGHDMPGRIHTLQATERPADGLVLVKFGRLACFGADNCGVKLCPET